MAKVEQRPTVGVQAVFVLDEVEMRALDAPVGYGVEAFLGTFYVHMGRHYLEPHEAGLRSLFQSVGEQIPRILSRTDDARAVFEGKKRAIKDPEAPMRALASAIQKAYPDLAEQLVARHKAEKESLSTALDQFLAALGINKEA